MIIITIHSSTLLVHPTAAVTHHSTSASGNVKSTWQKPKDLGNELFDLSHAPSLQIIYKNPTLGGTKNAKPCLSEL